jgi:serine/threonine protein kinase
MLKSSSRKGSPGGSTRNVPHTRLEDENEFEKVYEFRQELGRGSFGRVYEAQCQTTALKWAVKSVNKEKVTFIYYNSCPVYRLLQICQKILSKYSLNDFVIEKCSYVVTLSSNLTIHNNEITVNFYLLYIGW